MVEEALVEADERDSGAGGRGGDPDGDDDGRVGGGGSDGGAGEEEEEAGTNEEDISRQASRMRRGQSMIGTSDDLENRGTRRRIPPSRLSLRILYMDSRGRVQVRR